MALSPTILVQVALLAVVGSTRILQYPILFNLPIHHPIATVYKQSNFQFGLDPVSESNFPCPKTGYFANPQNCTRFYGCVAVDGEGDQYNRIHFECPNEQIFHAPYQSCLSGNCKDGRYPIYSQNTATIVDGHKQISLDSKDKNLTCPQEAFDVHPQNCTRFYRCADYGGTGVYTRYLYECPKNHIYLPANQTCYHGTCITLVQPLSPSPSEVTTTSPFEPATDSLFGPDESSTTEEPDPVTVLAPMETNSCIYNYVQQSFYCNVYHLCGNSAVRYTCPGGTVFDPPRQMCRISALDDGLCNNKEIFRHAFLLRSENIGSHVRLPDSLILPTAVPTRSGSGPSYVGQRKRPIPHPQLYIWPTPRPTQVAIENPQSNFEVRPAQVYTRPVDSQSTFGASFNGIRPVDHEHVHSPFEDTVLTYEENEPVFRPLLNRPAQVYSQPDDSVNTFDATFNMYRPLDHVIKPEYVGGQAAFRPLISRPAQVYIRPEDTQTTFNTFYSVLRPSERIVQTPASTRPLAEVRRPFGHLHFPRYVPYSVFASRPEDEEA